MRTASRYTVMGALAGLVVGIGVIGAGVPAFADQNYGTGPQPFPTAGVMTLGDGAGAPAVRYTGSIVPDRVSGKSCAPTITRHEKTDTIDYPAGC